ncbi:Hypothetical predicted protein [Lecanosticta acicola]|uniref:Uncharacterized protein n=1 Tax=Lecanosticta acicola TaxID=111012 RepID=A0AAI9EC93_9PEZI|nr:Hypothetical predicted protein [Lecanosticta acicola]
MAEKDIFPFFELAAELRNSIYGCVRKLTNLEIRDYCARDLELPAIPRALADFKIVKAYLQLCGDDPQEVESQEGWLQQASAQALLDNATVYLHIPSDSTMWGNVKQWPEKEVGYWDLRSEVHKLATIANMTEFELRYFASMEDGEHVEPGESMFEAAGTLLETWTKAEGWKLPSQRTEADASRSP